MSGWESRRGCGHFSITCGCSGSRVGVDTLSCYELAVRTNNHVEAFHRYLRSLFDAMNPGVWAFTSEYLDVRTHHDNKKKSLGKN